MLKILIITVRLLIVRLLDALIAVLAKHDKDYQSYRAYHNYAMNYLDYLKAFHEWKTLEKKYGSWSAVWENEPDRARDLELLLA